MTDHMSPAEHYREAERLLHDASAGEHTGHQVERYAVAIAQVHATLATAGDALRVEELRHTLDMTDAELHAAQQRAGETTAAEQAELRRWVDSLAYAALGYDQPGASEPTGYSSDNEFRAAALMAIWRLRREAQPSTCDGSVTCRAATHVEGCSGGELARAAQQPTAVTVTLHDPDSDAGQKQVNQAAQALAKHNWGDDDSNWTGEARAVLDALRGGEQ